MSTESLTSGLSGSAATGEERKGVHTPGPWRAEGDEVYSVPAYQSVCMVLGVVGEAEANARLIAAAPALLGALQVFVHAVESGCVDTDLWAACEYARATLAKAGA